MPIAGVPASWLQASCGAALAISNTEIPVAIAGKTESIKFVNMHKYALLSALGTLGQKRQRSVWAGGLRSMCRSNELEA